MRDNQEGGELGDTLCTFTDICHMLGLSFEVRDGGQSLKLFSFSAGNVFG